MAYYLGKNNAGDLASVLTGAYATSSPTSQTAPVNAASPLTPLNQTTSQTPQMSQPTSSPGCGVLKNGTKCFQCCKSKYADGTQEFDRCFDACMGEDPGDVTQPCDTNRPCPTGKKCVNGQCVDEGGGTTAGCPDGKGPAYAANPTACPCGTGWSTLTGKCGTGYTFIKRDNPADWKTGIPYIEGAIGTCQCTQAISDWKEKKGGTLGEYTYPPEMQALMDLLLSRGKDLMGMPTGYSQEAQDKMFGRGFENIRGQETGQRAGMEQGLSRQGMLGTGAGQGMLNDLSWQTEGNVANLARDLFVGNETKKKQDLLDYTNAAQGILGGGMGFEQLLEAINASRRGEGSASLQALLAWLMGQA